MEIIAIIGAVLALFGGYVAYSNSKKKVSQEDKNAQHDVKVASVPNVVKNINVDNEPVVIEARAKAKDIIVEAKSEALNIQSKAQEQARKIKGVLESPSAEKIPVDTL